MYIQRRFNPQSPLAEGCGGDSMTRSLGAPLGAALHASLLLVLLAHGVQRPRDGLAAPERAGGHRLPLYMMHLYRNFRSNFSKPLDNLERDASRRADTVKSLMAKSKIWFICRTVN